MELVTPKIGLLFWMLVTFSIVLFLLRKYAWRPILSALNEREASIAEALAQADKARAEMANLQSDNEKLLQEARLERDAMLKEARGMRDSMVESAKSKAKLETEKMLATAKAEIDNQKHAAIAELKGQVATLSLEIAEKVIKERLTDDQKQQALVADLIKGVDLN